VWKSLSPLQQEQVRSALRDAFLSWLARNQKENADALKEFREKHGVQVLRTPPEILLAYLKAWDDMAAGGVGAQPVLQEGVDSQRQWASVVGAGEALHAAAVLVRRELLLADRPEARGEARQKPNEQAGADGRRPGAADQPLLRRGALRRPAVHLRRAADRREGRVVGGDDVAAQTRQVFRT
jgi:hypothetical protein